MISNQTLTTTTISSRFGMPSCGYAFDAITGRIAMSGALTTGAVLGDRGAVAALAHVEKTFPWTSAWRPPIS